MISTKSVQALLILNVAMLGVVTILMRGSGQSRDDDRFASRGSHIPVAGAPAISKTESADSADASKSPSALAAHSAGGLDMDRTSGDSPIAASRIGDGVPAAQDADPKSIASISHTPNDPNPDQGGRTSLNSSGAQSASMQASPVTVSQGISAVADTVPRIPPVMPAAFIAPDPADNLSADEVNEINDLRRHFAVALDKSKLDPNSPQYVGLWQQLQSDSNEAYRFQFGNDAAMKYEAMAAEQANARMQASTGQPPNVTGY